MSSIPVTILTGFLGSGKTTLLNRILSERHGQRIAVIENEFGEAGIDNELLVQDRDEQIIEMNNGCICCTVRGDLIRILDELAARRASGAAVFDRVIIETTGLADPAPVAQTFFVDDAIHATYLLDAIVTVVDAVHAQQQLDEHHEAQEQVGFADRILLSKTDLVTEEEIAELEWRLRRMNPRAPITQVHFGETPLEDILDVRGFKLDAKLEIDPDFLSEAGHEHEHDDDVGSFVFRSQQPFDMARLEALFHAILQIHGPSLMRYKGILSIHGVERRVLLQGVHMLMGSDMGAAWKKDEPRESRIVFIGKQMPRELIEQGLTQALAPPH